MTTSLTNHGDVVITEPDHHASALAKALGGRRIRRGGVRYFLRPDKARQLEALYSAGFWPVRRAGAVVFTRDRKPLALYDALKACKKPLDGGAEDGVALPNKPISESAP